MSTPGKCFRGGKRIDLRPRKRKFPDANFSATVPSVLQLNIEGLSASKIFIIEQLANRHKALIILLQETHCTNVDRLMIPNFILAGSTLSKKYGLATSVFNKLSWILVDQSTDESTIEWLCIDVDGYKIVNIYKPPPFRLIPTAIPVFTYPCFYSGDFNCQHIDWGYIIISADGECLVDWAMKNNLVLLHNPKDAPSFYSGRWNIGTNPNLAFVSTSDRCFLDRRVLKSFLRSQHSSGPSWFPQDLH